MSLEELLRQKREGIVGRWLDEVLAAYPAEGGAFFKRQRDRFANPVGQTVREGTDGLFQALVEGADGEAMEPLLADMLRVRAIQEMAPSAAVGFVPRLKAAIRAELAEASKDAALASELVRFEQRIDRLALQAFDVYVGFRERLAQIRVRELQRQVDWILARLNGAGQDGAASPAADPPRPDGAAVEREGQP